MGQELLTESTVIAFERKGDLADEEIMANLGGDRNSICACFDLIETRALFTVTWNAGTWRLFPQASDPEHLSKLIDQVLARINAVIVDC
ncbi:MAG TPA: hypothetical protein VMS32_05200 [Verrucomicrobiae bacterium]|nr:hypothetical protein [Verrucomicrobiae bacterium]